MAQIGLGLLHHRHVEEDAGLAQLVIGAEAADRPWRGADNRGRLLVPDAPPIGPRADIDRILEYARDAAIIFRSTEQDAVRGTDLLPEADIGLGLLALQVVVLIVQRQVANLDQLAFEVVTAQRTDRPGNP